MTRTVRDYCRSLTPSILKVNSCFCIKVNYTFAVTFTQYNTFPFTKKNIINVEVNKPPYTMRKKEKKVQMQVHPH